MRGFAILLVYSAVLAGRCTAQVYSAGICPEYQTSPDFTAEKIKQMVEAGGMMPFLASGTLTEREHTCQYLQLMKGGTFTYTYRDTLGTQRTINGDYTVKPSSFKEPGYIRLALGSLGLLGSDITGNVHLYPVKVDPERQVFMACTNFGFFHAEYAYAFVNARARSSVNLGQMKYNLIKASIPLSGVMTVKDQTCFDYDVIMSNKVPPTNNNEILL